VEEIGEAHCDLDQAKMTWSLDVKKLPLCMADCAKAHELSHVDYGKASCAKIAAAYKAVMDAIAKAEKSKSDADLKEADQKMKDFEQATKEYTKWFNDTCRDNERTAYQAGIDACSKADVQKSCADLKETDRYEKLMKEWQTFRNNPPNCPAPAAAPAPAPAPSPAPAPAPNPPAKTPPAKLSVLPSTLSEPRLPASTCACGGKASGGGECAECKKKQTMLQRSPRGTGVPPVFRHGQDGHGTGCGTVPPIVHEVLRSPGQPLDAATRTVMEPRLGHDFSRVRVHTNDKAAESAHAVNALAYAVGRDIVFAAGQYAPQSTAGRELLAHELVHTMQQDFGRGESGTPDRLMLGDPGDAAEREAASVASTVLTAGHADVAPAADGQHALRRDEDPGKASPPKKDAPTDAGSGSPGTEGETGGSGSGGSGASPAAPVCQPKGLDRAAFLAAPGTSKDLFGLTALDTSGVTFPTVNTFPAKPRGVTVGPTSAALPTIPSVFTRISVYVEGETQVGPGGDQYSCDPGKYPLKWSIATKKIGEGEQEHCNDFQYAFDISLKKYAEAVNDLASKGRVFSSHKDVEAALTRTTGVAPAKWQSVFNCLVQKTTLRDPPRPGDPSWHSPRPFLDAPRFPKCQEARAFISDASLPEVGNHPSSEIIKGCGEKPATSVTPGKEK